MLSTSGTEGVASSPLPTGRLEEEGIRFHILPVPEKEKHSWSLLVGDEYDADFEKLLQDKPTDWVITFGDEVPDQRRRQIAKKHGAKILFALHNEYYRDSEPSEVDLFLVPSLSLENVYREAWGNLPRIKALPTPIDIPSVLAEEREPVFAVFVNPHPVKGLRWMIRLADELGRQRLDIPLQIVGGRSSAGHFLSEAARHDIDLRKYENLYYSESFSDVKELWKTARVLLMPSVWNEPAGRLPVEAALNGVLPITSDRGGLPEQLEDGAPMLPLPEWLTPECPNLPSAEEVTPWLELLARCYDDELFYQESVGRAKSMAEAKWGPELALRYEALFGSEEP